MKVLESIYGARDEVCGFSASQRWPHINNDINFIYHIICHFKTSDDASKLLVICITCYGCLQYLSG